MPLASGPFVVPRKSRIFGFAAPWLCPHQGLTARAKFPKPPPLPRSERKGHRDALFEQLQIPPHTEKRRQDIYLLQSCCCREKRAGGHSQASLFPESAARKPAAPRRRPDRKGERYLRVFGVAEEPEIRA